MGESKSHVRLSIENGMLQGTIRTSDDKRLVVDPVPVVDRRTASGSGFRRRKGVPGVAVAQTACKVNLYADKSFYDAWGGSGSAAYKQAAVVAKMTSLLQSTDAVYSDPENFGQLLSLVVGKAEIIFDVSFATKDGTATTTAELLSNFQEWIASSRVVKHDSQPCLHQLFTHTVLADSALGSSTLGVVDNGAYAGACSTVLNHDHERPRATNTGVISSLHGSDAVEYDVLLYTLVHELGHSFGAQHTCCLGDHCPPRTSCAEMVGTPCNPIGLKYVMHPELTITGDSSLLFSECSKAIVHEHIAQLSCLVPMHPCDNGGPCCDGPNLRPHGTVCRPANPTEPCSQAGFCTGVSHECPASQLKSAGAVCGLGGHLVGAATAAAAAAAATSLPLPEGRPAHIILGVCTAVGTCEHPHTTFCKERFSTGAVGCTLKDMPCTRSCITADGGSSICNAVLGTEAYGGTPCNVAGSTNAPGLCSRGGECDALATGAASGLAISHGIPPNAQCAWSPSPWTSCSRSCGRGVSEREFDCVCSSNNGRNPKEAGGRWGGVGIGIVVDVTGEACQLPKPTDSKKQCNIEPCPECTSIELVPTLQANSLAVELSGWYKRSGGPGTDYPELMHNKVHFKHDGGKDLFMYHVNAYGKSWWIIGPRLGSSYQWSAYIQSDADVPSMATDTWAQIGAGGIPVGGGVGGSNAANVVLEQRCACESPSLVLDPATNSQCVYAAQLQQQQGHTRGSEGSEGGTTQMNANNPMSTSTPQPEEGFTIRTTRAPRQCPLYYAPAPNGTGCIRQYLCDKGVSSAGGKCDCGDNSCNRCHLSSTGEMRCLQTKKTAH